MFDWQDLRHFLTLARTGSLSAAARDLRVDHATVGRRVAALERALGQKLIDRLPRSCRLTPEGLALVKLAGPAEDIAHAVERLARGSAAPLSADVRISAPPAVAARLVAPRVAAFKGMQPGIRLILSGAAGAVSLDRGEADLAIRMARPPETGLVVRRIGTMRFGLYGSRDHAEFSASSLEFIAYDASLDHVAQQVWLRQFAKDRPIVFQASDLFGQQEAARAGLGVAVLPCFMGDTDAELVRLPAAPPPPLRDLWLVTYPDLRRSPAIRAVIDFLATTIAAACPISRAEPETETPPTPA